MKYDIRIVREIIEEYDDSEVHLHITLEHPERQLPEPLEPYHVVVRRVGDRRDVPAEVLRLLHEKLKQLPR